MAEVRRVGKHEMQAVMEKVCGVFSSEQGIPMELIPVGEEYSPQWWGAFQDHRLIGTAAVYVEKGQYHMGRITVDRELRGQRIGSALIEAVLADLFGQDVQEVFLDARRTTVNIILRLGGEIVGEEHDFYGEPCTPIAITKAQFRNRQII